MGNKQTHIKPVDFNDLPDEFLAEVVQYVLTQSSPQYVFMLTSTCKRLRYVVSVVLGGLPVYDGRFVITVRRKKRIAYTANYPWWVHPQRNYLMRCRWTCNDELYGGLDKLEQRDAPYRRSKRDVERAARLWKLAPVQYAQVWQEPGWCHHENNKILSYIDQFPPSRDHVAWTMQWVKRARYYSAYVNHLMSSSEHWSAAQVTAAQAVVNKAKSAATNMLYPELRRISYTQRIHRGQLVIDIMTGPQDTLWQLRRYIQYVQAAKATQKQLSY